MKSKMDCKIRDLNINIFQSKFVNQNQQNSNALVNPFAILGDIQQQESKKSNSNIDSHSRPNNYQQDDPQISQTEIKNMESNLQNRQLPSKIHDRQENFKSLFSERNLDSNISSSSYFSR